MMTQETTEVCVIGGGPGGVFLSAQLNKQKIPHVVMEASPFPRSKPCADTISIHIVNKIKEFFPEAYLELKGGLIKQYIKGVRFCPPNNKSFNYWYPDLAHFKGQPSSYMIKRAVLDEVLLKAVAKQPFAKVIQPCRAEQIDFTDGGAIVQGKGVAINCKAVLVAAGGNSLLASKLTGNQADRDHYALGLRAYYKGVDVFNDDLAEFYLNKQSYFGAFYISALGNDLYNVNMVMSKGSVEDRKTGYRKTFLSYIENHPVLKGKFKEATLMGEVEGHPLVLGTKRRKVSHRRALFVGDAAGLIDIVTANGIPQAMKSAEIAVETYLKAKEDEEHFEEIFAQYDNTIYTRLKGDLAASKIVGRFIGKPFYDGIILFFMRVFFNAFFINFIVDLSVYGRSPFKRMFKKGA